MALHRFCAFCQSFFPLRKPIPSLGKISLNQIPKGYIPVPSDIQLSMVVVGVVGVVGVEPVEYGQINMKRHKVIFCQ